MIRIGWHMDWTIPLLRVGCMAVGVFTLFTASGQESQRPSDGGFQMNSVPMPDSIMTKRELERKLTLLSEDIEMLIEKRGRNLDKVVDNAFVLFGFDNAGKVYLSEVGNSTPQSSMHVLDYLKRLQNLPYKQVTVTGGRFAMVDSFFFAPDGRLHGYAEYEQEFTFSAAKQIRLGKVAGYPHHSKEEAGGFSRATHIDNQGNEVLQNHVVKLKEITIEERR